MYQFTANDTDEFSLRVVRKSFGTLIEDENECTHTLSTSLLSNSMVSFTARDTLNASSLLISSVYVCM